MKKTITFKEIKHKKIKDFISEISKRKHIKIIKFSFDIGLPRVVKNGTLVDAGCSIFSVYDIEANEIINLYYQHQADNIEHLDYMKISINNIKDILYMHNYCIIDGSWTENNISSLIKEIND